MHISEHYINQKYQLIPARSAQIDKDYSHPLIWSDPDSQTDPHQNRNTWRSCNAATSHGRHTGFASGRVGKHYPLPLFPLSDAPRRCIRRTTTDCRPYRSSHVGCRFGRSRSSGFAGGFRRLRLSNCVLVPRVRSCRDRCRYKYTCRPKQIQFSLRGRLRSRSACVPRTLYVGIVAFIRATACFEIYFWT